MPAVTTSSEREPDETGAPGLPRRNSTMQILRAAEEVFARHGFAGTSMAEIAEAAGLPKANLHYYFGSKEQLYRAVLEDILASWLRDADIWIVTDRTPADGIGGYIRAKMAWTRTRGDASRIFAGEMLAGAPHVRQFLGVELRAHVDRMEAVFAHWTQAGLMRPISARHLLFCIWAMTQSYADFSPQMETLLDRHDGLAPEDYDEGTRTILQLVLQGCGAGGMTDARDA